MEEWGMSEDRSDMDRGGEKEAKRIKWRISSRFRGFTLLIW